MRSSKGRRKKRREDFVKDKSNGNRYHLAPSLRDKPTNVPEIERLNKLKRSMTTSVLGEVSAMSALQRQLANSRRVRAQKQRLPLEEDSGRKSSKKRGSKLKPTWNPTNTAEAKLMLQGEHRCPSPYHDPAPTGSPEKAKPFSFGGDSGTESEWSTRHQQSVQSRVELQRKWEKEKVRMKQSYSQPKIVIEMQHKPVSNKAENRMAQNRRDELARYEKEDQKFRQIEEAEEELAEKIKAVQLPDMRDAEAEKLEKFRGHVTKVDDFISSLPALGTW